MDWTTCMLVAAPAEDAAAPDLLLVFAVAGGVLVVSLIAVAVLVRRMLHIVSPGQLLVVTGRRTVGPDGRVVGYRLLFGPGRVLRLPFVERVDVMDLTPFRVGVELRNVQARGGASVLARVAFTLGVSREPKLAMRAVERFLSQPRSEWERVAASALEAVVRSFVAARRPEQLDARDEALRAALEQECAEACETLGLAVHQLSLEKLSALGGGLG